MSEILSPHITPGGVNTFGTLLDIQFREGISDDPAIQQLLLQIAEGIMVVFPKEVQESLEDAIISAIQEVNGRFNNLNLLRISGDAGNSAIAGTDNGIYVPRRTVASIAINALASQPGVVTLPLPEGTFTDTDYQVNVEHSLDPGTGFRWWVVARSTVSVSLGYTAGPVAAIFRITVQA